jgi:glycolate oxidase iron-sulfur subunit
MLPAIATADAGSAARIVALADQCVKCGLCQPHCPTYRVSRTEAESPRGRIALAKALALGTLEQANTAVQHLDQCLACLRCERVCPSQVHYGELIAEARHLLRGSAHTPARLGVAAHPRWLRLALRVANIRVLRRVLQSRPLARIRQALGLQRAIDELPRLSSHARTSAPAPKLASRGRIGLFLGCVASVADRDVHAAAQRLLSALGYTVVASRTGDCCGALALHAGEVQRAASLGAATRQHAEAGNIDTLLVSASGCFGTLRDHALAGSRVQVREIHEFLAADKRLGQLGFRALAKRALLHTPCTQASVARAAPAIHALLRRIPQMDIVALPDTPGCCGAAGDYFLRHPAIADALRAQTLAPAQELPADLLITSNVGCRMFLDNGLRQCGLQLPVIHPVALLARQLEN